MSLKISGSRHQLFHLRRIQYKDKKQNFQSLKFLQDKSTSDRDLGQNQDSTSKDNCV